MLGSKKTQSTHPAACLLGIIKQQDLTQPGRACESTWWGEWSPLLDGTGAHVTVHAPTLLGAADLVASEVALLEAGGKVVRCQVTKKGTRFSLRLRFDQPVIPAGAYVDEDEEGRPRIINLAGNGRLLMQVVAA